MKLRVEFLALIVLFAVHSLAQDTNFPPSDQQIPAPACAGVAVKDLWFPGSKVCGAGEHEAWLTDIRHWRDERRIRVGYDGSRYDQSGVQVDAIEFHSAADDGAGPVFLRSGGGEIYGRSIPR